MAELRPYQREFISRELDLTKDQERRFFPIYEEMNDRIDSLNEETRELERRTIDTPDASDTELEAAAQAVFDLKQKEGRIEAEYFEKFKEILTPRQLLKLKSAERKVRAVSHAPPPPTEPHPRGKSRVKPSMAYNGTNTTEPHPTSRRGF